MADSIEVVDYFYLHVADKPGMGARILARLREDGVNLLVFSGFPEGRRGQLDVVPADAKAFKASIKKEAAVAKVIGPKKAFWVRGEDRPGAVGDLLDKLGQASINVTAATALCAGAGRYGMILWVNARDVARARKVLGAK